MRHLLFAGWHRELLHTALTAEVFAWHRRFRAFSVTFFFGITARADVHYWKTGNWQTFITTESNSEITSLLRFKFPCHDRWHLSEFSSILFSSALLSCSDNINPPSLSDKPLKPTLLSNPFTLSSPRTSPHHHHHLSPSPLRALVSSEYCNKHHHHLSQATQCQKRHLLSKHHHNVASLYLDTNNRSHHLTAIRSRLRNVGEVQQALHTSTPPSASSAPHCHLPVTQYSGSSHEYRTRWHSFRAFCHTSTLLHSNATILRLPLQL